MIQIEHLKKIFRTDEVETTALSNVDPDVKKGEFVTIMGPSGCGRSTLLNILGLLDSPSGGKYYFDGKEASRFKERQRTGMRKGNVGFVFQSFNLIDEMNVYENVDLPLMYLKIPGSERSRKVGATPDRMLISHRKKHFTRQLSGGKQQRVAVARAVVADPKFILADEPAGDPDSKYGDDVMSLLYDLNAEGTTFIILTHSPAHAERAERVIHLFDGSMVTENICR